MRRLWLSMLIAIAGCKTVPVTPASTLDQLNASRGGHVSGPLVALSEPLVLNREDFVFDAKFSADGSRAAISRLAGDGFHASLFTLPSTRDADPLLNISEFDVEGLEFSPDGARVAAVSRDGTLRVLDAHSGALIATWKGAEALVSVAWSTRGERLAVGSSTGIITVVDAASLAWVADVAAHHDEVRGLAFRADGSLVSASWDRTLQVHTLQEAATDEARLRFERVNGVFRVAGVVARTQTVTVAFDSRAPATLVRAELARSLNLDAVAGSALIGTADGPQLAYKKKLSSLSLRQFSFEDLTVAVCDLCIPDGVSVVLGEAALARLVWAADSTTGDLVIKRRDAATRV
ncbi:MAG: aspartyl protease family protein, partial [Archangium sp.]